MFRTIKQLSQKENRPYTLALAAATATDYAALGLTTYLMKEYGCSHEVISATTPIVKSLTFLLSNVGYHKYFKEYFQGEEDATSELKHITLSNVTITGLGMLTKGKIQYELLENGFGPISSILIAYPIIGALCFKIKTVLDTRSGVLKKRRPKETNLESLVQKE